MASRQQKTDDWKYAPFLYGLLALISVAFLHAIYAVNIREHNPGYKVFLALTVAIPELAIWAVALKGAVKYKAYTNLINKSKDGDALNNISNAILWIVAYIVLLISGSAFVTLLSGENSYKLAVMIYNHVPLLTALIAMILLFRGARKLNKIVRFKVSTSHTSLFWVFGIILSSIFIVNFVQSAPDTTFDNARPRFVAPVEMLLFTYVIPHIIVWGLGAYSVFSLLNYSLHVKGEIYKRFFRQLYWGLTLIFTGTFFAQFLILAGVHTNSFNPLVIITYAVLLLGIYGFMLIYRGASKLQQIESV